MCVCVYARAHTHRHTHTAWREEDPFPGPDSIHISRRMAGQQVTGTASAGQKEPVLGVPAEALGVVLNP